MKFQIIFAALLMSGLFAVAPQSASAQASKKAPWKEMHDFHEVMSVSFHSAEEGNLAPLREKAGMLVERAQAWKKSPVPAGYNPKMTKEVLKRLVKQCKVVEKGVKKKKTDAELTAEITKAHDVFHEIMEKCRE